MLLSLNTCGSLATAALGVTAAGRKDAGVEIKILATARLAERTSAARLVPEIAAMLEACRATVRDLRAVVVVNGPGSFTGVRVGVSTAKGLAEGAGIPVIAVSRLALLAGASGLPHVLAAIGAGRGEYFLGEYRNRQMLSERLLSADETMAAAREPGAGVLVCDESSDAETTGPRTSACAPLEPCGPVYVQQPDAAEALRFALERWRDAAFDDPETLQANYLRRPDAELVRAAQTGQVVAR